MKWAEFRDHQRAFFSHGQSKLSVINEVPIFYVFTVMPSKIKMQTIQYRESRIWEIKEDEYTKNLAKNQVCAIFLMQDIQKNVLFKFIQ